MLNIQKLTIVLPLFKLSSTCWSNSNEKLLRELKSNCINRFVQTKFVKFENEREILTTQILTIVSLKLPSSNPPKL